jgi:hypothetical protein
MDKEESDKKIKEEIELIPMNIVKDKKQFSIRIPAKIVEALDISSEKDSFLFIFDKENLNLRGLLINKEDIDKIKNG